MELSRLEEIEDIREFGREAGSPMTSLATYDPQAGTHFSLYISLKNELNSPFRNNLSITPSRAFPTEQATVKGIEWFEQHGILWLKNRGGAWLKRRGLEFISDVDSPRGHLDYYFRSTPSYAGAVLTDEHLEMEDHIIAETMLHEGHHDFIKEHNPSAQYILWEGLACYAGYWGAIEYCALHQPDALQKAITEKDSFVEISRFINNTHLALAERYDRGMTDNDDIISEAMEESARMLEGSDSDISRILKEGRKCWFNNAFLIGYYDYTCLIEGILTDIAGMTVQELIASHNEIAPYLIDSCPRLPR